MSLLSNLKVLDKNMDSNIKNMRHFIVNIWCYFIVNNSKILFLINNTISIYISFKIVSLKKKVVFSF